jgi:hypothetical protein
MNYLNSLRQETNVAFTANGAFSNASTLDANLDFFSRAAAMRGSVSDAVALFEKAFGENPALALKNLFYMRDIRGGQGERTLFRKCLVTLPKEVLVKVIQFVPAYGRWDDLLVLPVEMTAGLIKEQLFKDEIAMALVKPVSLLAKWLTSENASSKTTKSQAIELMKALGFSPKEYRNRIVALRKHIKILEQLMSAGEWSHIDFEKIPSQAHRKHTKAFKTHNKNRYEAYLAEVAEGKKKIKTSTLYTYEVYDLLHSGEKATANAMWKNLPDFTNGKNALVVADVSGSMLGRPMSISVSLALYFAERNAGAFHNYFMTFTDKPQLQKVVGSTLHDKMNNIESAEWGGSTNIMAAFQAILNAAINNKSSQEELPSTLYIISDMAFNTCVSGNNKSNFSAAEKMFEEAGYRLPHVVFWNVNSFDKQVPATKFDNNVTLISGSAQNTFRYAVEGKSPLELMWDVLTAERYSPIAI